MRCQRSLFEMCRHSLVLLVTLALSTVSIADSHEFLLLIADVPGTEEYESGDLDAAIELLESTKKTADNRYLGKELATLCGFYILKDNLDAAREICSVAVKLDQSALAYNNRAVLRVRLGDAVGALKDFDRVRVLPDDQPRYMEQLIKSDARLTASSNFAMANEIRDRRRTNKPTITGAVTGAKIEDMNR